MSDKYSDLPPAYAEIKRQDDEIADLNSERDELRARVAELEAKSNGGAVPVHIAVNCLIESARCFGSAQAHDQAAIDYWDEKVCFYRDQIVAPQQPVQNGLRSVVQDAIDELGIMDESDGVAGWHKNGDIATWDEVGLTGVREYLAELLQQPAQGQWVKCLERLPTEDDEDVCRQIWGWIDNKGIGGKWFRMSASEIKDMAANDAGPICKLWMPTGLKRPIPPTGGE